MAEIVRILDGQPAIINRGTLVDLRGTSEVWLWDCGPEEPTLPEPPEPPEGKEGNPKYDLAKLVYKRQLKAYEDALLVFERADAEYKQWHGVIKGPVELCMWSTDARDALTHDARAVKEGRQSKPRYHLSSRTRGNEKLKNGGLPAGVKPGPGHQINLERQLAGDESFIAALRADPHFGQEMKA